MLHFRNMPSLAFWRVDNALGTFLPADPTSFNLAGRAYDLRHIMFGSSESSSKSSKGSNVQASPSSHGHNLQSEGSLLNSALRVQTITSFRLIWCNQGSNSRKKLSIWRPEVPQGTLYFGDIAVKGYMMLVIYFFLIFFYSFCFVLFLCSILQM